MDDEYPPYRDVDDIPVEPWGQQDPKRARAPMPGSYRIIGPPPVTDPPSAPAAETAPAEPHNEPPVTRKADWSDGIAVHSAFVEAVHADDDATAADAGHALVSMCFKGEFEWPDEVAWGVLLREDLVPQDPDSVPYDSPGVELLDGVPAPERFEAIKQGDKLRPRELLLWQKAAAENILANTDLDWDIYAMWAVRCVHHDDGREAYLAATSGGYSFTMPWSHYKGHGKTIDDALDPLKSEGFISVEDYRERGPNAKK
jgi:hypothetical protein